MSFRKRNVGLSSSSNSGLDAATRSDARSSPAVLPGLRPSPLDGRATTSTGTATLDGLLAGHAGLPMGTSVLLEENGTTDYAGALLRYFAAEGLVQGHHVHVIGVPEQWGRELPGLVESKEKETDISRPTEKMKIAWRYERLEQAGTGTSSREPASSQSPMKPGGDTVSTSPAAFCHAFDLTKRLVHPVNSTINFFAIEPTASGKSPFSSTLARLISTLNSSPADAVHRVVIPSLLSPALYPPHANLPEHLLQFLHGIRALLSSFAGRLSAMLSLPLSLYPRSAGLVRWMELLNDGVIELSPFPHSYQADSALSTSASGSSQDETPQGLLRIHRLPLLHERGSGNTSMGEDWAFTLSRKRFSIKPFSLPPIEGDTEAQRAIGSEQKEQKGDLNF